MAFEVRGELKQDLLGQDCPLCGDAGRSRSISGAGDRRYYLCENCHLIFVDRRDHVPRSVAEAHYRTHENGIEHKGYVTFLERAINPLLPHLSHGMRGLDFGSGPGPTLSVLIRRLGFACDDYDPLFAPRLFERRYDFIFATECFEHFERPVCELEILSDLLIDGGFLVVMTERWTDLSQFQNWYYARDPTHVSFFSDSTFDYVCRRFGFRAIRCDDARVRIFQRNWS